MLVRLPLAVEGDSRSTEQIEDSAMSYALKTMEGQVQYYAVLYPNCAVLYSPTLLRPHCASCLPRRCLTVPAYSWFGGVLQSTITTKALAACFEPKMEELNSTCASEFAKLFPGGRCYVQSDGMSISLLRDRFKAKCAAVQHAVQQVQRIYALNAQLCKESSNRLPPVELVLTAVWVEIGEANSTALVDQ